MINKSITSRYAKALFNLDLEKDANLEKRIQDLETLTSLLESQPKIKKFFSAPHIKIEEKENLLKSIINNQFDSTFVEFLYYLLQQQRLMELADIGFEYRRLADEHLGIWEASLMTAIPINEDVKNALKTKLESYYNKKIKLKELIDPQIIGGARLVVANQMIDWTLKNRIRKLKERLNEF